MSNFYSPQKNMPRHQFTHFITAMITFVLFCWLIVMELSAAEPSIQQSQRGGTKRIQSQHRSPNIYQEGMAYIKRRQFEAAVAAFQQVIQRDPNHADAYNYMGEAYYELEEYQQAADAFEKALRLNPRHIRAKLNLEVVRWQLFSVEAAPMTKPRVTGVSEILRQIFSGYFRGATVSGLMYMGGYLVGMHNNNPNQAGLIITGVSMTVGSTAQVYQTGEVWGQGGGSSLKTVAGGLLGPLIGALILAWDENDLMDSILTGAAYGSFFSPIGATLGYQLSKQNRFGILGYHRSMPAARQLPSSSKYSVFTGYSPDASMVISMGFQF